MPDMTSGEGINIGDAVLSFVADTQKLDQGIDSLNARVEAGMSRSSAATQEFGQELDATGENADAAGEVIQDSMQRSSTSIREAKGEAMLLGEAFGVHLPRHVTSFISTLPGVGEALSAAFAATAVLFIIEAIVKLTEKTTDFVSSAMIYTDAMKSADEATATLNAEILKQEDALAKAKEGFDNVGKSATELAKIRVADSLTQQLAEIQTALEKANAPLKEEPKWWKQALLGATDYFLGTTKLIDDGLTRYEAMKNNEAQATVAAEKAKQAAAEQTATVVKEAAQKEDKAREENMATFNRLMLEQRNYAGQITLETNRMMDAIMKLPTAASNFAKFAVDLNSVRDSLTQGKDAAHQYGITLKDDLVKQLDEMQKAFQAMNNSGAVSGVQLREFNQQIKDLQAQINNFGKEETTVNAFFEAFQKGGKQSQAAMWGFADAYSSGMEKVIAGEESIGPAMEAATKQFIGQIGARAMVQGMFYLAQGIADTFWNPPAAAADFAASAEFLAIGALATGAAAVIPGGGSGSGAGGSSSVASSPVQTTGSSGQNPVTHVNTQSFASGGLISSPTMAMLGDSPSGPEAVLPLGDEQAMSKIAEAVVSRMGSVSQGGGEHTFNGTFFGQLRHSDLKALTKQINAAVNRGTATLHSTKTGRITKKSA